jgi:hypothetical protein
MGLGLQAARLRWKASYQRKAEQQQLRQWYDAKWRRIKDSPWLRLPDIVIAWLVRARTSLPRHKAAKLFGTQTIFAFPVFVLGILWVHANYASAVHIHLPHQNTLAACALLLYGCSLVSGVLHRRVVYIALLVVLTSVGALVVMLNTLGHDHKTAVILSVISAWPPVLILDGINTGRSKEIPPKTKLIVFSAAMVFGALLLYAQKLWLNVMTLAPLEWATLSTALTLPFIGLTLGFVPALLVSWPMEFGRGASTIQEVRPQTASVIDNLFLFGFSVALSFTFTLAALFTGHRLDPQAWVPQTQRMLWSNALFDGLTVVTSLYLLERALPPKNILSVPAAVSLDLLLGIVFACASLWCGVRQLTMPEVGRVLVAHSIDGNRWEIGPYFWAMHTVFIPLLFYLVLVLSCCAGKAVLEFREWFYDTARDEEINGLNMAMSFLGLVAVVLGTVAAVLRWFA